MKVGVLLSAHDPRTGGGHTFEAALLDGLLRCAAQSDHTFVVLVKGKTRFQDAPNVRFEHLTEGRKTRAKLLAGVSAVTRWRPGRSTVAGRVAKRWLEQVIVDSGTIASRSSSPCRRAISAT